jgi:predicted Zn-dependent peptidase/Zn-finger nucleic acid-binding protein
MALEMGFDCPECGADAPLASAHGPFLARACDRCGGALLGPQEAKRLVGKAGSVPTVPARLLDPLACPSCGDALARLELRGTQFAPCAACGAAWVGSGLVLDALGARRSAGPERLASRRRGRWPAVLAVAVAITAAAAGFAWFGLGRPGLPGAAPAVPSAGQTAATPAATLSPVALIPAPSLPLPAPAQVAPKAEPPPLLLAPAASPESIEEMAGARGQPRILLAPRSGQTAAVLVRFACGAVDDATPGLTRMSQHALLAANQRLDLARYTIDLHAAAATLQMTTGLREAAFLLTADRRDFPLLARRLLDALLDPRFVADRMPAATARASLDAAAAPEMLEILAPIAVQDGRYLNAPVARRSEIEAITAEQVADHLEGLLSPANATVVLTGAFNRDEALLWLRRDREGRAVPSARARMVVPFSTRRPSPREVHVLAFPLSVAGPRDAACARVAQHLLSDALWRMFRETGVGYSHEVSASRTHWMDVLILTLAAHDTSSDLGAVLRDTVAKVRYGRFEVREFDRARSAVRGDLLATDADPRQLARELGSGGANWHGAALAAELERLDRAAFVDVVRPWLDASNSVYVYLGRDP